MLYPTEPMKLASKMGKGPFHAPLLSTLNYENFAMALSKARLLDLADLQQTAVGISEKAANLRTPVMRRRQELRAP